MYVDFISSLNSRRTIGPLTGEALKGLFHEIFYLVFFLNKSNISLQAAVSHSKRSSQKAENLLRYSLLHIAEDTAES
jgi:hypothetical protein